MNFLWNSERIASLMNVATGAPEVLVKVTGVTKTGQSARAHLEYLGREEDSVAELSDGQRFEGRREIGDLAQLFDEDLDADHGRLVEGASRKEEASAVHVVFSMGPNTVGAGDLMDAVREAAGRIFDGHEHALVLHSDKGHLHVLSLIHI